ncbi:MAG: glycerol-3-phosphate dehydrogenase/oxidase [Candidatus Limnocylindria bacterium]
MHDALVVGGGIIGAGIARDLAGRGCSVALVERSDLASGTSSRPTRLIHGGLRYLEMFDFALVRADMREREILLRSAPHLVRPLAFLIPLYEEGFIFRQKLRVGMRLYDALSFDKSLPKRRWLSASEVAEIEPSIRREGLRGAWRFFDAQVSFVERLVLENALAAAADGAVVLTHAPALRFLRERDRVIGAVVRDDLDGSEHEVRARIVVNATGPWLDRTGAGLRPGGTPLLRLTKGTHVVTPPATAQAHVLYARSDGRLFFVIPWAGQTLIGTTDTDYAGDPAEAAASESDVGYLLAEARRAFPTAAFDRVNYTYAGVRALVREEGVKEGDVSRKHGLYDHLRRDGIAGVVSVVGGKITGYRLIAEELADHVTRTLGARVRGTTADAPLPGAGADVPGIVSRAESLGVARAGGEHLARLYGACAGAVLDLVDADRSLAATVCEHAPDIAAQLRHAVQAEWAVTLGDALLRRTTLGLAACQALHCLEHAAQLVGQAHGWSDAERDRQQSAYRAELAPMRAFSAT